MNKDQFPVLYILMRNDMQSMNAGKAMAQASHASNAFIAASDPKDKLVKQWQGETGQGFGTVLVLSVNEKDMRHVVWRAERMDVIAAVVHDPTYPLRDGDTTHFLPVDTCAYVFADKNDWGTTALVGRFSLHP